MTDQHAPRGRLDPRTSAITDLLRVLRGQADELIPHEEVQRRLPLSHMIDRGIEAVPLAAIVGSLNRSEDFDRAFLPQGRDPAEATEPVPASLYLVGGAYFVVDGHQRIAVAREAGAETIEAQVREFGTEVPVAPIDSLASILAGAAAQNFAAATGLTVKGDEALVPTAPAGYDRLIEYIAGHQYHLGAMYNRTYTWDDAVRSWHATVYRPVVQVIREHGLLKDFPGRTETDLYLWVSDRLHELREQHGDANLPPIITLPVPGRWRRFWRRLRPRALRRRRVKR